jgi:RNA polymerase sigma-70 factor (ECF subfamily)
MLPLSVTIWWKAETVEQDYSLATMTLLQADSQPAKTAANSAEQFAAIVREYQSMVFSLARNFLRDRALAEEIAQEAFFRLYKNLSTIESRSHMVHWLRKVTSRLCIDEIRRRPARRPVSLDDVDEPMAASPETDPLLAGHLRRLVAGLPDSVRMTIILRYQEDMDPLEIARMLDVPLNTIKSRLHRGLLVLRARCASLSGGIET